MSSTTAAEIDAGGAADRSKKQTVTSLGTMVSRRPLMFEESIEPVVPGMSDEQRFLLDMQGCKFRAMLSKRPGQQQLLLQLQQQQQQQLSVNFPVAVRLPA